MARLYKPQIIRYTDPGTGKRCAAKTPGAVRKIEKSNTWRGEYRDGDGILRTVALSSNKQAAAAMLAEAVKRAEHERAGLRDPFADHRTTRLADHLGDYEKHLAGKNNTARYVSEQAGRIRAICSGCGFKLLADLSASRVAGYLSDRRAVGLGTATSNHYLTAVKGFTHWLVKDRRAADDVLVHLGRINAKADVRRERRTLSPADFGLLVTAAEAGPERYGLSGSDRALLYRTAAYTGLRASELASLSAKSFDLKADPPTVTVEAGYSKRRRRDVLPVHSDLASNLREWFKRRSAAAPMALRIDGTAAADVAPLWPGEWAARRHAAAMLRGDLTAAGLAYTDDAGGTFDFHALRHQFISMLAAAGVHPKEAQELARHSDINLTLSRYTHVGLRDTAAAVGKLPSMAAPHPAKATGTGGSGPIVVAGLVAGLSGNHCRAVTTPDETATDEHGPEADQGAKKKPPQNARADGDCGRLMTPEQHAKRREGDSNSRYREYPVHRISNPALSATQPSLRATLTPISRSAALNRCLPRLTPKSDRNCAMPFSSDSTRSGV